MLSVRRSFKLLGAVSLLSSCMLTNRLGMMIPIAAPNIGLSAIVASALISSEMAVNALLKMLPINPEMPCRNCVIHPFVTDGLNRAAKASKKYLMPTEERMPKPMPDIRFMMAGTNVLILSESAISARATVPPINFSNILPIKPPAPCFGWTPSSCTIN